MAKQKHDLPPNPIKVVTAGQCVTSLALQNWGQRPRRHYGNTVRVRNSNWGVGVCVRRFVYVRVFFVFICMCVRVLGFLTIRPFDYIFSLFIVLAWDPAN